MRKPGEAVCRVCHGGFRLAQTGFAAIRSEVCVACRDQLQDEAEARARLQDADRHDHSAIFYPLAQNCFRKRAHHHG
jgi:hypothetical protein